MEEIIIADSDVIIDYFNGIGPSAEIIADLILHHKLGITTISVFELLAGIIGKKRLAAIELLLSQATLIPLNAESASKAAGIYTELKKKGRLIGNQDILIAGICLAYDLPLFTRNFSHFQQVTHLRLHSPPLC